MEIFLTVAAPLLMTLFLFYYNNRLDIKEQKGIGAKAKEFIRFKKNKVFTLVLGLFGGIAVVYWSHFFFTDRLETSLKLLFLYELLIAVAYVDYKSRIIPNKLLIFALASFCVCFLYDLFVIGTPVMTLLINAGLGLLLGGGVFLFCGIIKRGSMGMGDVKLFAVLGLFLGYKGVFNVIFFSIFCVAAYAIAMLLMRKKDKKSEIPIGPFALLGMMISIVLGIGDFL